MGRGEDMISNLPNEILQFILCFMPLKYAIRTSTLSKRWKHLWQVNLISSTSLQFDENFSCSQSAKQFVNTVDRYLCLHGNNNLDKFSILFSPFDIFFPNLGRWICTAISKGVKELDIDLSQGIFDTLLEDYVDERDPFQIPNSLFKCYSITHLSLSRCNISTFSESINFVKLISLSLTHVSILDDMLKNIIENCDLLASITLKCCASLKVVKFTGDKLNLQKLTMVNCKDLQFLEISAPKLESFVYCVLYPTTHIFGNLSQVNDVCLCTFEDDFEEDEFYQVFLKFLHVKVLTICSFGIMSLVQFVEHEIENPLELHNMQELQIIVEAMSELECINCCMSFFALFPAPFLEKLFIQLPINLEEPFDLVHMGADMYDEPNITFDNLKWIKISNFEGSRFELELIKFLLEKSNVLESMYIVIGEDVDTSNDSLFLQIIQGQLSVLPKASRDVQIVICGSLEFDCAMNPTHSKIYHRENYRVGRTILVSGKEYHVPLNQEFL